MSGGFYISAFEDTGFYVVAPLATLTVTSALVDIKDVSTAVVHDNDNVSAALFEGSDTATGNVTSRTDISGTLIEGLDLVSSDVIFGNGLFINLMEIPDNPSGSIGTIITNDNVEGAVVEGLDQAAGILSEVNFLDSGTTIENVDVSSASVDITLITDEIVGTLIETPDISFGSLSPFSFFDGTIDAYVEWENRSIQVQEEYRVIRIHKDSIEPFISENLYSNVGTRRRSL